MLAYGIYVTPAIAISFAAPKVAELLNERLNWRWTFGASACIVLASCLPITIILFRAHRASRQTQLDNGDTTKFRTFRRFSVELDIPGIILGIAGLCLMFIPVTIANKADNGYRNTGIIVMIVVGFSCLIGFAVWGKWLTPASYMHWELMRNRNLTGGCLVISATTGSMAFWSAYYGFYLQVVHNLSITISGYIGNTSGLVNVIAASFFGM